ncbi:Periplasmic serine protease, Do/DeqQ family [Sterolibacterium denitrificans]|uniref:Periplasmic serine protease, Do/DeqQ family n=1 Tax=Sterolibacterium denitrificans TaxID=157592 RepID=A0A7Z7HNK1_9PROT|nr:Do family serine endopeptidase [Sterolibacterium denitrificans]SMB21202.1 Periplasmic serine protease, Do/DeqQ family [Sterolibacterium denitrificans]
MHRLWLIFAQAVTISVAGLFAFHTLQPLWFAQPQAPAENRGSMVQEAAPGMAEPAEDEHRTDGYRRAAQRAMPSVVHIFTSQEVKTPRNPFLNDPFFRHFFGDRAEMQPQRRQGLGSGVIVNGDGYILTNNHVIADADDIEVATQDGRKYKARIVGGDPDSDLAVVRVDLESGTHLSAVVFAPPESLRIGDVVLAIGNPFGVGQTVTHGIVSALGRSHLGINTFENFIQTDAAINPGNSGGALVDARGHLVGINTAIYSQSGGSMGIGFAIPVSLAKTIMEQIIQTGTVTRGWIGVEVQEITPELAESFKLPNTEGALIAGVMRGGPADLAGIRPGDVLLAVAGTRITDPQSMLEQIASQTPGQKAVIQIRRDGREGSVAVLIARRPKPRPE